MLEGLTAGDRVVIHAGEYAMDSRLSIQADGTEQDPITIEAAAGDAVIIRRDDASQNIIDFDRASYVTVKGIEWIGGSIGIRLTDVNWFFFVDNEVHDDCRLVGERSDLDVPRPAAEGSEIWFARISDAEDLDSRRPNPSNCPRHVWSMTNLDLSDSQRFIDVGGKSPTSSSAQRRLRSSCDD